MAKHHKEWVVTASGHRSIHDVAKDLAKHGFKVGEVFGEIGSLTGTADDGVAERARAIPGVSDISPVPQIDIGPPDADVS